MSHKQIILKGISIDEGLASLIAKFWDDNIETIQCCQGGEVREKHKFVRTKNGPICLTFEDELNVIKDMAHLIFLEKDLEYAKKNLPADTKFIIGDKNADVNFFEYWIGSFNGVWAYWKF